MYISSKFFTFLVLGISLILSSFNVQADRSYLTYYGGDCLSFYGIYNVVRQALPELREIDPSVSQRDLIYTIKSSARCVTREDAEEIIAEYAKDLNEDIPPLNNPPLISGTPVLSVSEGQSYSFTPYASDTDGDTLKFQISNQPSWASFNTATGELNGSPSYTDAGSYPNIVISVSDGQTTASLSGFTISVSDTNRAPSISGTPQSSIQEGGSYSFTPVVNDADGDKLVFSISGIPNWAIFNSTTGTLSGSPSYVDAGSYPNISIRVSDGKTSSSLAPFSITVADTNRTPSISGTPNGSVQENSSYSFRPSATDEDGDNLVFSISGLPDWASFDPSNGKLAGVPGYQDAGSYENIVIRVSDGKSAASLAPFTIVVENLNRLPTIGGDPDSSATVGDGYSFTPIASDPDGDVLSFSISNLPPWAEFDSSTGTLSGTPKASDIGIYEDIFIMVSDSPESSVTFAMTITVDGITETTGTASLSWQIPTSRTDGSVLAISEVEGFRIYMGPSDGAMVMVVDLNDGSQTNYTLNDLPSGSYHFAVTTYDTDGNESDFSNIAVKEIL